MIGIIETPNLITNIATLFIRILLFDNIQYFVYNS